MWTYWESRGREIKGKETNKNKKQRVKQEEKLGKRSKKKRQNLIRQECARIRRKKKRLEKVKGRWETRK